MKVILILGAGRSSAILISYLLKESEKNNWQIIVGDISEQAARARMGNASLGSAVEFNIHNESTSRSIISQADVVISLMPPHLHILAARYCMALQKHLITASYTSDEMKSLDTAARAKGLLFLNECGLDPGLDHMTVMKVVNNLKSKGGKILSVESFTGGLIAPETDPDNPWQYKFSWNPRNVITAGQGAAKFLQNGKYKYIPYQQLFMRTLPIHVTGYGEYEGYVNRDSLKYIEIYGLQGISTMIRGTLRTKGYCSAWNIFVQLGCCDDTYEMENVDKMTHQDFIDSFIENSTKMPVEEKLATRLHLDVNGAEMQKLKWSGLFNDDPVGLKKGTPAQVLEHILNKKWRLNPEDKDLIVMWHRFVYEWNGIKKEIEASLVVRGDDATQTAMAKTVGLPLGIAASLLLRGKILQRGVILPVEKEIYDPLLKELYNYGIEFKEEEILQHLL